MTRSLGADIISIMLPNCDRRVVCGEFCRAITLSPVQNSPENIISSQFWGVLSAGSVLFTADHIKEGSA